MKTVIILHENDDIDRIITTRWLASFTELKGVVMIRENRKRTQTRIKREIQRVGILRFFDVMAFRLYYKLVMQKRDRQWREELLRQFARRYPEPTGISVLTTHSPNSPEAESFIKELSPDIIVARCKTILKKDIYGLAATATLVFHPGICPEYRNAHGCFWALVNGDYGKVGMTLLKIDDGIDTGPIYGYYSYPYDRFNESHIVIQTKVFTENLNRIQAKLSEIHEGAAMPIDVRGRQSNVWGQPWLTQYLRMRFAE